MSTITYECPECKGEGYFVGKKAGSKLKVCKKCNGEGHITGA